MRKAGPARRRHLGRVPGHLLLRVRESAGAGTGRRTRVIRSGLQDGRLFRRRARALSHANVIATVHEAGLTELGANLLTRRDKRRPRLTTQCADRDEKERSSKRVELGRSDDLRIVNAFTDLARVHLDEMTDFDSPGR